MPHRTSKLKKLGKALLRLKINLVAALLLSASIISVPLIHGKLFRSYVGTSTYFVTDLDESKGSGSGFIVKAPNGKKYFITNNHVCEGLEKNGKILVSSDMLGKVKHRLKIITRTERVDLCVAEAPNGSALSINEDIQSGDIVHIFGHPIGFPLHKTSGEVIAERTIELLSGKDIFNLHLIQINSIQISAPSSPGNSGSPVVDNLGRVGRVVGVLFAGSRVNSYTSFIIPARDLVKLLESL